jgi:tetratricopeptide (TPR) repeat protein
MAWSEGGSARARRAIHMGLIACVCAIACGCNATDGIRPVIAVGGETIALESKVELGRALLSTRQYGLAVETLTEVVRSDPSNARAMTLLAVGYDRLRRHDLADRYYERALDIDPAFVPALNNWGYSQLLRRNYAKAENLLRLAKDHRADDPVIEANLRLLPGYAESKPAMPGEPVSVASTNARPATGHVFPVKRRNVIIRTAPGVQTLFTRTALPSHANENG